MKNEPISIIESLELEHARLNTVVKINTLIIYAVAILGAGVLFLMWS